MTGERDEKGHFKKGVSGNPGGRRKDHPELRMQFIREVGPSLAALVRIRDSETAENRDKVRAAQVLIEYAIPKPSPEKDGGDVEVLQALVDALRGKPKDG